MREKTTSLQTLNKNTSGSACWLQEVFDPITHLHLERLGIYFSDLGFEIDAKAEIALLRGRSTRAKSGAWLWSISSKGWIDVGIPLKNSSTIHSSYE